MVEPDTGGWTLQTLFIHLSGLINATIATADQRFLDSEKAVKAALEAADKAVAAALQAQKDAAEKAENSAQARHVELVQRLNQTADILTEKITSLALRYEGSVGTSHGKEQLWGYLVGAVGVAAAVVAMLVR